MAAPLAARKTQLGPTSSAALVIAQSCPLKGATHSAKSPTVQGEIRRGAAIIPFSP
jgi:hypothetical protein